MGAINYMAARVSVENYSEVLIVNTMRMRVIMTFGSEMEPVRQY